TVDQPAANWVSDFIGDFTGAHAMLGIIGGLNNAVAPSPKRSSGSNTDIAVPRPLPGSSPQMPQASISIPAAPSATAPSVSQTVGSSKITAPSQGSNSITVVPPQTPSQSAPSSPPNTITVVAPQSPSSVQSATQTPSAASPGTTVTSVSVGTPTLIPSGS